MVWLIILIFVLGYAAITLEHTLHLNKAASALVAGVLCWTVLVLAAPDYEPVLHDLEAHLGEVSGIL
ncbi:MAG: sodium:proton antiporter, partial [Saprospiraceae bacterium]|nr:sodium:proton antiporter [Saprospiraceae bacterium]